MTELDIVDASGKWWRLHVRGVECAGVRLCSRRIPRLFEPFALVGAAFLPKRRLANPLPVRRKGPLDYRRSLKQFCGHPCKERRETFKPLASLRMPACGARPGSDQGPHRPKRCIRAAKSGGFLSGAHGYRKDLRNSRLWMQGKKADIGVSDCDDGYATHPRPQTCLVRLH